MSDSLNYKRSSIRFAVPKCAAQQEVVRKQCFNSRECGKMSTLICLPETSLNRDATTTLLRFTVTEPLITERFSS